MRNKPRPENQCRRKWRRQWRRARRYDPEGVDAAIDAFVQFLEDIARSHDNVKLVGFPAPTSEKP